MTKRAHPSTEAAAVRAPLEQADQKPADRQPVRERERVQGVQVPAAAQGVPVRETAQDVQVPEAVQDVLPGMAQADRVKVQELPAIEPEDRQLQEERRNSRQW